MKLLKQTSPMSAWLRAAALVFSVGALASSQNARAQSLVYSQNFETDTTPNWIVNVSAGEPSTITSAAWFFFDYSTAGIPKAPHSAAGDSTYGLKMVDNCGAGGTGLPAISVCPIGFGISDNFDMHMDMWLNWNGAGVAGVTSTNGNSGSTVLCGAGFGTAGTTVQGAGSADSIFCGVTTDGGSSADYRLYTPAFPSSYQDATTNLLGNVYLAGSRNNSASHYTTNFLATACPPAQTNIYHQQYLVTSPAGTIAFAWHDVELKKVANTITYLIDGVLIATAFNSGVNASGTPAGTNILFFMSDINNTGSLDVQATNLQFMLIDNVRITNFPSVVTVTATQPNASETGLTPGTFTITRSQNNGLPVTIHYTMSGTATNGSNYHTLSGTVTMAASDSATNITLTPYDDGVPEATMTAIMTIQPGTGYIGAGSDTVYITDNDTPVVDITCTRAQAYDRYANDYLLYHLNRRGLLSSDIIVGLSFAGSTAIGGTDYTTTNNIELGSGAQSVDFAVYSIPNPAVTGNRSVSISVTAGTGYTAGSGPATGTIIDSDYVPAPVLLVDALTNSLDGTNWSITYGTGDPTNNAANYNVDFGFDLTTAYSAAVPPPPGGAGFVLHETCNKLIGPPGGAAGAVNAYYTNQVLSGNYAVRFNMNLIEGSSLSVATEGAVFGINHTGTQSNWWYGSGPTTAQTWGSDGIWYFVASQAAAVNFGDYAEFTGAGGTNGNTGWTRLATQLATSFKDAFKNVTPAPAGPFTSIDGTGCQSSGIPANGAQLAYDASTWSDVEMKQINNIVTLSINHTQIFSYTNTTVWTNGYLMLGYTDPYGGANGASVGNPDGSVYYANLQVVQLTAPAITSTTVSGGNITLAFSSPDSTATFVVQSASVVTGPYTDVSPAPTIVSLGNGHYQFTTAQSGAQQFYRIRYK